MGKWTDNLCERSEYSSSIGHMQMLIHFSFKGLRSLEALLCITDDLFRGYLPKIVNMECIEE